MVLFLSVCSRAFALTADRLPPSSFANTEVSTNVAPKGAFVVASGDNFRYLLLDLELNATPSNTYVFAWQGVAENRDGNQLTERRIELCRNGDAIVSTNGVSSTIPYEIPFAHDPARAAVRARRLRTGRRLGAGELHAASACFAVVDERRRDHFDWLYELGSSTGRRRVAERALHVLCGVPGGSVGADVALYRRLLGLRDPCGRLLVCPSLSDV